MAFQWHDTRQNSEVASVTKSGMLTNVFGFLFGLGIVLADLNTKLPVEFHP